MVEPQIITGDSTQRDIVALAQKIVAVLPQVQDDLATSVSVGALATAFGIVLQHLPPQHRGRFANLHAKCMQMMMEEVRRSG